MPLQYDVRLLVEVRLLVPRPSLCQQGVSLVELVVPLVVLLEELMEPVEQMEVAVELPQQIPGQRNFLGLVGENCFFCDLFLNVLMELCFGFASSYKSLGQGR